MHGRDYCRYSRAVFSEDFELFKALIFFCSFPFHSFFLLSDFFRLQCGVAKISHKIYSVKQFLKKIILASVYAGAFLFHKVVEE